MIINNNISAMNTYRQLTVNNALSSKSLERLSSGLRINRAGDDAAGLAISEKMRGQIRGLKQATRNAQDGISLIQTAEGALNETHAILQRMRELATQAANQTNNDKDLGEIQKEVNQLAEELTRIATDTEFNTKQLLSGDLDVKFHIGANEGQNINLTIDPMSAKALKVVGDVTYEASSVSVSATYTAVDNTGVDTDNDQAEAVATIVDGTYTVGGSEGAYTLTNGSGEVVATSSDGITFTGNEANDGVPDNIEFGSALSVGDAVVIDTSKTTATVTFAETSTVSVTNNGLEAGTYKTTTDSIVDAKGDVVATYDSSKSGYVDSEGTVVMAVDAALGENTELNVGGIDVSSQASADSAITRINDAIEMVSAERSKLGAYQNRLEHTINNLGTSAENLQAAESRIRDLDMAEEMMAFTKNNILQQAATAMLAQANMAPQSVLQLLR
jgi:flagellin